MALVLKQTMSQHCMKLLQDRMFALTLAPCSIQIRERHKLNPKPKLRNPVWFVKKTSTSRDEFLTLENKDFVDEVVKDEIKKSQQNSPLTEELFASAAKWQAGYYRTGVIGRKIGVYPMWTKNGQKILTTLLQVLDNHVIKYYPPDEYTPGRKPAVSIKAKKACLLIGAEAADPTIVTKEYCGLFKNTGVVPKKHLARFFVSPEAVLPIGTPLNALHYQIGNIVDVRGQTIDRGFQGVMKRHGFKGMPASHGVTKTHRRGGNIGGGGEKGRVWPGTKMPGHMGNRYRILRGLRILRINTKYNVLYVTGQAIPGAINSIVRIYDTILPLKKAKNELHFPTYQLNDEVLPENLYYNDIQAFTNPTIEFKEM